MICTIKQAADYLRQLDPCTTLDEPYIKRLVEQGAVLSVGDGADCLVSTSDVLAQAQTHQSNYEKENYHES